MLLVSLVSIMCSVVVYMIATSPYYDVVDVVLHSIFAVTAIVTMYLAVYEDDYDYDDDVSYQSETRR